MLVEVPPNPGGLVLTNQSLSARGFTSTFTTLAAAIAASKVSTTSFSAPATMSNRVQMSSGRIPHGYVDTQYFCHYTRYRSKGHVEVVGQAGSLYRPARSPLGFGYTGSYDSGLGSAGFSALEWYTTQTSVIGLANQALTLNLQNRLQTEARLKALDTGFDGGEFLTGLSPSVKMVSERAISLMRAFIAVRKGNFRAAADVLGLRRWKTYRDKDPANVWLEFFYGWKPLVTDIFEGTEEIARLLEQKAAKPVYVVTRRGRVNLGIFPDYVNTAGWDLHTVSSALATCEVKLRFSIKDDVAAYFNSLRVSNPAYIAWTALPYSFVVDWMLPVGDMLSAITSHVGLKFHGGYMTTRAYGSVKATSSSRDSGGYLPKRHTSGTATAEAERLYLHRVKQTTWPWVIPYVKFPFSSAERAASAVSLIAASKRYR